MGEPATSAATAIGSALGAGLGAMVLNTLGVHPQALLWALIGATLGMSLAPQASRMRAVAVFACVVLSSALLGTWVARTYADGSLIASDVVALLLAIAFHPLLIAFLNGAPAFLAGWLKRFSAPGEGKS
jgi:hypothetical protein